MVKPSVAAALRLDSAVETEAGTTLNRTSRLRPLLAPSASYQSGTQARLALRTGRSITVQVARTFQIRLGRLQVRARLVMLTLWGRPTVIGFS